MPSEIINSYQKLWWSNCISKPNVVFTGKIKRIFEDLSDCVFLLFEKELFNLDCSIILLCVYVSPEYSSTYDENNQNGIEILTERILMISSKYPNARLFLAGDCNARVGNRQNFIENDDISNIFLNNDVHDYPSDSFHLRRFSKDNIVNNFGLSLLDMYKSFNMHILNGRCKGDGNGELTCNAKEGRRIVEYFIASSELFDYVTSFCVG